MSSDRGTPSGWGAEMVTAILWPAGILLPERTIHSDWFIVLTVFVAINTVMYVALAIAKSVPRVHPREWLPRKYRRSETRSIHPEGPR